MVGINGNRFRRTTRGLTSELGGAFAIMVAVAVGKSMRQGMRRRASWMALDLRRRRSTVKPSRTLLHGLPFGNMLPSIFFVWKTIGPRLAPQAPGAGKIRLTAAAVAETAKSEPALQARSGTPLQLRRPSSLPTALGFTFTPSGAVAAVEWLRRCAPFAADQRSLGAAPAAFSEQQKLSRLVQASQSSRPGSEPQALPPRRSEGAHALSPAAAGRGSGGTIAPFRPKSHSLQVRNAAAMPAKPALSERQGRPNDRIGTARLAAIVVPSGIIGGAAATRTSRARPSARENEVASAGTGQEPLRWASTTATNIAPPANVVGSPSEADLDPPRIRLGEQQPLPSLVARRQFVDPSAHASAISALSIPVLRQLVMREVAKQVAAAKASAAPLSSSPPQPAAVRMQVRELDLSSDDAARRLMSKMRAISRAERFRDGLLR
jgi:hypothetical protein